MPKLNISSRENTMESISNQTKSSTFIVSSSQEQSLKVFTSARDCIFEKLNLLSFTLNCKSKSFLPSLPMLTSITGFVFFCISQLETGMQLYFCRSSSPLLRPINFLIIIINQLYYQKPYPYPANQPSPHTIPLYIKFSHKLKSKAAGKADTSKLCNPYTGRGTVVTAKQDPSILHRKGGDTVIGMADERQSEQLEGGTEGAAQTAIIGVIIAWNEFEFVVVSRVLLVLKNVKRDSIGRGLSKRQLMKLEKAIKMFESQETHQIKHPKRRSHPHPSHIDQLPRKQLKIDHSDPRSHSEDAASSPLNSSEPLSSTPPPPSDPHRILPEHLNPNYHLPQGQGTIFNYLLFYTYSQGEKRVEKESRDWSILDQIGDQTQQVQTHPNSTMLCSILQTKMREVKDRLKQPLGKAHRDFNLKFLRKDYLPQ